MKGLEKTLGLVSRRVMEMAKAARGQGTIIVHPQLSRTVEEAKELGGDWSKREAKQVMDNLAEATGGIG
jgi:hypothetical protein